MFLEILKINKEIGSPPKHTYKEDKRHPRYRDESRGERGFPSKRRSYQKGKTQ